MGLIEDLNYTQSNLNIIRTKTSLVNNESLERVAKTVNNMNVNPYLQEKTITPSSEDIEVLPDNVYLALSKVNVNGDANLVSENIKRDIEIFGVTGTLDVEPPLQDKEILPSTESELHIKADDGYYGLNEVLIDRVRLLELTVEPRRYDVIVTPGSEYMGLSKVIVKKIGCDKVVIEPDFSSGDSFIVLPELENYFDKVVVKKDPNLVPENIREGVTINGITGTYKGEYYTNVEGDVLEISNAEVEGDVLDI